MTQRDTKPSRPASSADTLPQFDQVQAQLSSDCESAGSAEANTEKASQAPANINQPFGESSPHSSSENGADDGGCSASGSETAVDEASPKDDDHADDYVGYKHPPKHTRFRKGESGNAGGKKRGTKSRAALVKEICDETVSVNEGGKRRKMSRFEFSLRRLVEKAMKGEAKALQLLIGMMETGESPDAANGYTLTEEDKHIIDTLAARMKRKGDKS